MASRKKEKFDLEKTGDLLVAKYVTSGTVAYGLGWRNLYDFVHHCMKIAYTAGKAAGRAERAKT